MSDNKRSRRGGQGYYIALILCAAAIGITGYVYHRNTNLPEPVSQTETAAEVPALGTQTEDVPVIATQPPKVATGTAPAATTPPVEKKPMQTMSPVAGESIFGYSMEALSYNQTTRDWRVHNGVDLAAEPGTQVAAAADGAVATVYEDDAMGTTCLLYTSFPQLHRRGHVLKSLEIGALHHPAVFHVQAGDNPFRDHFAASTACRRSMAPM